MANLADCNPQGSPGWLLARCGRATASEFSSVLAKGQGKTRASYLRRILAERLVGAPIDTYHNGHMDRGQAQEGDARGAYEDQTGAWAVQCGFIPHPEIMSGCSPDSLIETDGVLEIKSVIPTVQVETILRGGCPPDHRAQTQGELWITGRKWLDFVSWSPDMPEHLRLYVYRVMPDPDYIAALEKEVRTFLAEVDRLERQLMDRRSLSELLLASIDPNSAASQA